MAHPPEPATRQQKEEAERAARKMLDDGGLPQPDEVEYGDRCIRLLWHEQKFALVVDLDEPPSEGEPADGL